MSGAYLTLNSDPEHNICWNPRGGPRASAVVECFLLSTPIRAELLRARRCIKEVYKIKSTNARKVS